MRPIYCLPLLLWLNLAASAAQNAAATKAADDARDQTGYCPQTHALQAAPTAEYWFEGFIGKTAVRMYLDRGGDGVVGLFYSPAADWTPTLLGGEWSETGIALSAESDDHSPKGHLQGRIEKSAFIGSWTANHSNRADPVRLTKATQPACDGRGPWKRFADPKWPLAFSYPASWRLQQDGKAIELICPDPQAMAYNSEVAVHMGTGEPHDPDVPLHCADGWRYGPLCKCRNEQSGDCRIPKISQDQGRTILNLDETEWRVYCRNEGYVGQGYGEHRFVLAQNGWIDVYAAGPGSAIVDRLARSAVAPPAVSSK